MPVRIAEFGYMGEEKAKLEKGQNQTMYAYSFEDEVATLAEKGRIQH